MKIRVCIANWIDRHGAYVEINCEGLPNPGDYFRLSREIEKQLLCNVLADYATARYFGQWIDHDNGEPYMSFEDASVVYDVSWGYDNKEEAMMCYVALDLDKKGELGCYADRLDGKPLTYDEYLTIKMNTEKTFGL